MKPYHEVNDPVKGSIRILDEEDIKKKASRENRR